MTDRSPDAARAAALKMLARREYAVSELAARLAGKGFPGPSCAAVVGDLVGEGLVSDERFAEALVRVRTAAGYGPRRLRAELSRRGVNDTVAARALATVETEWSELAAQAAAKRFRDTPADRADWLRRARFLEGRGFTHDQVMAALDEAPGD